MFRVLILITISGLATAAIPRPPPVKYFRPDTKNDDSFKFETIVGGESQHIRTAPQDPIIHAGEEFDKDDDDDNKQQLGHYRRNKVTTPSAARSNDFDQQHHQAQSAHYSFDASVKDDINDHSHVRTETRDGTKVTGMYSYSDGFYYRTVHYVADENGYRIVKQEQKRIGNGPVINPGGQADVSGSLIGGYSIKIDDQKRHPNYVDITKRN